MVSFVGLLYFLMRINKIKMPFNKKHSTRELAEYYSFGWRCLRAEETEREAPPKRVIFHADLCKNL